MTREGKNFFWIFVILSLFAGACSDDSVPAQRTEDSTVVAVVNGDRITTADLQREMRVLERLFRIKDKDDLTPEESILLKTNALNRIIQNVLMLKEAASENIRVTLEESAEALLKAKNGYQEDTFQKFLAIEGIPLEEWENKFKNNLLIKKLINTRVNSKVSVSESDLQRYYADHKEEFEKAEQVRALHIMVETEAEARDIHKQLKSGKKDFSSLAQEYSQGPEGAEGGDLGYFATGQMPVEFDDVFKLKNKQISSVIQTPYGYHIFKVVDKKAARKMSFEESREIIQGRLLREAQDKAFGKWLIQLKEKTDIKIDHEVLAEIN